MKISVGSSSKIVTLVGKKAPSEEDASDECSVSRTRVGEREGLERETSSQVRNFRNTQKQDEQ
jgi:hypothetical protein